MKEKFRKTNAKKYIALRIRPTITISTIKSKYSHCDSKDQNPLVEAYTRYIQTVPWSLGILCRCLRTQGRMWTALHQIGDGSALHCLYSEVYIRGLALRKDRTAFASLEHTLQKWLLKVI